MKYVKWTTIGICSFLILYLGTVWIWATSSASELLSEIPRDSPATRLDPKYIEALIKIEDPTFYSHIGVDISNGQGLTTITSSLAARVFLGDHQLDGFKGGMQSFYRGVFACCKRIDIGRDIMALALNSHVKKGDQLNMFMSSAYLGSLHGKGIIGFENAAIGYYGKQLSELTEYEFFGIIAMLIAPNHYHPVKNPQIHPERVRRIEAVIRGECKPDGWLDLSYDHCIVDA